MHPSMRIMVLLPILLQSLPSAFARPQLPTDNAAAVPPYTPGYATASPIDEMNLAVFAAEGPYQRNPSAPCSGFVSLNTSQPLPSGLSSCIAGIASAQISSAPAIHNMTCVQETTKDARLEACTIVGYVDSACGGAPVQTQRVADGWAFAGTVDVQSFKVDCTGAESAA